MLSNLSNKKLLVIFGILLIVVVVFFISDSNKEERTFKSTLVDIDTTSVTAVKIYPKKTNHEEVSLIKNNDSWSVTLDNGKIVSVSDSKMKNLFNELLAIKAKRLAARGESKWNELQVDTTGTRVAVYEGSDKVLDIVIGKIRFQQPRSVSTYVRLTDDQDVYEVDGFLEMSFNQDANYFRNSTIIKDDFNNWSRLSFEYPADSSFQVAKQGDNWFLNGSKTDSAKTVSTLRQLANISGSEFVDTSFSGAIPYKLTIDSEKLGEIVIEGYVSGGKKYIHSSQNPEAVFDVTKNKLFDRVFISKSKFFK